MLAPSGWEDGVQNFQNSHPVHEFAWSLSEIITALLGAGLTLEHFREYDHTGGFRQFKAMVREEGRRWVLPPEVPSLPLMYSVVARKAG